MIEIKIELNGDLIAAAKVKNMSALADISSYDVATMEVANRDLGISPFFDSYTIERHKRKQSVWALVKRIADRAAEKQK